MSNERQEIIRQIESYNTYDYKDIAWKILTDDDIDESFLLAIYEDNTQLQEEIDNVDDYYDSNYLMFEALTNITWEMFYGLVVLAEDANLELDTFRAYFDIIKEKFVKVKIHMATHEYTITSANRDYVTNMIKDRYCRTIIRDESNRMYFVENNIDVDYQMMLNESHEPKSDLKDIFSILMFPGVVFKIYYDKLM